MLILEHHAHRGNYTSVDDLMLTKTFAELNLDQKVFLVRYLNDGMATGIYDAVAAVQFAYAKNGVEVKNANIRAYQILRSNRIRKILDLHFKRSGLEHTLNQLRRCADKSAKLGVLSPETKRALAVFAKYVTQEVALEVTDTKEAAAPEGCDVQIQACSDT